MKKLFLLIVGISLLIGIISGLLTSEKRYYLLLPTQAKREITQENYKAFFNHSNNEEYDFSKFTKIEKTFNFQNLILGGLITFSILLILSYFFETKKIAIN